VPFILIARPTPAGGRIWVWLRPGLALSDLESRRDKIAVACWAKDVRLTPASKRYAALVQVNITRRNPLTGNVRSPLPGLIPATDSNAPVSPAAGPAALDLPDVPEHDGTDNAPVDGRVTELARARTARTATPASTPAAADKDGDDITDWL
jgi:hypothetical protein